MVFPKGFPRKNEVAGWGLALAVAVSLADVNPAHADAHGEALQRALHLAETNHYAGVKVDDRISRAVLHNYLAALDGERLYFTVQDEDRFLEQYGSRMDDLMREGISKPMLDIFRLYDRRRAEFGEYAKEYVKSRPALESLQQSASYRSEAPRAADQAELADLWRRHVRREWARRMEDESDYEAVGAVLHHRYQFWEMERDANSMLSLAPLVHSDGIQHAAVARDADSAIFVFLDAFARALHVGSGFTPPPGYMLDAVRRTIDGTGTVPVRLGKSGNGIAVQEVYRPSSGLENGLRQDDQIISVDPYGNREFVDVSAWKKVHHAEQLLPGPVNTSVSFRVVAGGDIANPVERKMLRVSDSSKLNQRMIRWAPAFAVNWFMDRMYEDQYEPEIVPLKLQDEGQGLNVAVIRIPAFYRNAASEVRDLIRTLNARDCAGLVLDLRGSHSFGRNAASKAVVLAGMFVGKGPIAQERDRNGEVRALINRRQQAIWRGSVVVLINEESDANAELVAAAIGHYGRGVIAGINTVGTGMRRGEFKLPVPLGRKSADGILHIPTHRTYRNSGTSIHPGGIRVDIRLPDYQGKLYSFAAGLLGIPASIGEAGLRIQGTDRLAGDRVPSVGPPVRKIPRQWIDTISERHSGRNIVDGNVVLQQAAMIAADLAELQTVEAQEAPLPARAKIESAEGRNGA